MQGDIIFYNKRYVGNIYILNNKTVKRKNEENTFNAIYVIHCDVLLW